MISHRHRFISLHIPKTGGTSINKSLKGVFGKHCKWTGHVKLDSIVGHKHQDRCGDYFKFAFVRNPWDRFLSCYFYFKNYGIREGHDVSTGKIVNQFSDFEDFACSFKDVRHLIKSSHLKSQTGWIDDRVDFIGRFESLQQDFNAVCDKIGIGPTKLSHKNKSEHKPYYEYYNSNTQSIVGEIYKEDIKFLGYKFYNYEKI